MKILGISAFYHDSAAAIIVDGAIIAAAQEERFSRIKHDAAFPNQAIAFCLRQAGLSINELDAIAFYDKPLLKFERLLETYYGFAPKGLLSFIKSMPVWIKEKLFLKRIIREELAKIEPNTSQKLTLLFPEHHLSHSASAFYASPFEEAAILTIDGVGEWTTASISRGKGNAIELLKELRFPHSVGLLYSAFTYFLGFKVNSGEYKLMGLAPYGNPDSPDIEKYIQLIKTNLVDIKEDGSIWLNQNYFNYAVGLRMAKDNLWKQLFGFKRREEEEELEQHHCNLGFAIQQVTEEIVLKMATSAQQITGCENLCLAGGVALNCVANGKIERAGIFKNIFIQPASGDAGGALGAAQAANYIFFNQSRTVVPTADAMMGSYLGPEFDTQTIALDLKQFKAVAEKAMSFESLAQTTAALIAEGNVVGWFQGRMEFGPRALGNRSILGDARNETMQKKLNLKIKYREGFRPFAPAVLAEDANDYFDLNGSSPYMLLVAPLVSKRRKSLPQNYNALPLFDRLYTPRSDLQSITHIDFSARVQTVEPSTNPRFYRLLKQFKQQTGYSVLVNTSFNVRGEPPVCTPAEAYACFMRTEMDYLVIGDFLLDKKKQPAWNEKDNWQSKFVKD